MSEKFNGAVTAMGASLIAKAIANNTKMSFLKIIGSKSTYTDKQLPTLTDDVLSSASHDQEGHISNVTIADETTIKTELVLDGSSVEADYQLNTVLILATVDGTDHLFGALKANQPQYMNAYDGKSSTNLEINCSFKVANADAVSITVDTAGTLTVDDYNRLHAYTDAQVASASGVANKRMDSAVAVETKNRAAAVTSESTARSSAVAAEATARSNAVSDEASARAAADTKLQNSATANSAAIGKLQTSAATYTDTKVQSAATVASNATSTEAVNRTSAVAAESTARSNAVSAEVVKRAAADSTESSARAAADTKLQNSATANAAAAAKAQTTANNASSAVVNEATARTNADATINKTITTNDGKAVHITGNETVRGNKAFTGTDSFSQPIKGSIAKLDNLSGKITVNDKMTEGWYYLAGATITDAPPAGLESTVLYGFLVVRTQTGTSATNSITQKIEVLDPRINTEIYRQKSGTEGGSWGVWSRQIVDNMNQTFSGKQTFLQPLRVSQTSSADKDVLTTNMGQGDKGVIRMLAGPNASGDGVAIGAGGMTIMGGGESARTLLTDIANKTIPSNLTSVLTDAGNELGIGMSDNDFYIITNFQNNDANSKIFKFGIDGNLTINGGVAATQSWANGVFALKAYTDTRNDNQNPKWYLTNHPGKGDYYEFKLLNKIGINAAILPSGITNTYGACFTTVGPADGGAGYPDQVVKVFGKSGGFPVYLHRVGVSDTEWSKWYLEPIIERG